MLRMKDEGLIRLAETLHECWVKYSETFGDVPHGTTKQLGAMLCFSPKIREYIRLYEKQREEGMTV